MAYRRTSVRLNNRFHYSAIVFEDEDELYSFYFQSPEWLKMFTDNNIHMYWVAPDDRLIYYHRNRWWQPDMRSVCEERVYAVGQYHWTFIELQNSLKENLSLTVTVTQPQ